MKPFAGYKSEAPTKKETLPAGGYVAQILDANEVPYTWGKVLLISFDITEGEHKGFFAADYRSQVQNDKKWRGTIRLNIPKEDGTERDEWTKTSFGNATWALENSNNGYKWDWNETGLKGKTTGVLFRNKEWEFNGKTGWTTECCALTIADSIRNNLFKTPKDKPLALKQQTSSETPPPLEDSQDLPF